MIGTGLFFPAERGDSIMISVENESEYNISYKLDVEEWNCPIANRIIDNFQTDKDDFSEYTVSQ